MLIWTQIPQDTAGTLYRVKVPGGWLIKEVQDVHLNLKDNMNVLSNNGYEWTTSITFVPDLKHEWVIDTN